MAVTSLTAFLDSHEIAPEEADTDALIAKLKVVRKRGFYTRREFCAACHWKSPRARRHYEANTREAIERTTRRAFASRSERERVELLETLRGVSAPMASALLTLADPKRYGVIDIRVWQLLYRFKAVSTRPSGVGFAFNHWYRYLMLLRHHARRLDVSARAVERTLFQHHRRYSKGRLYG